MRKVSSFNKEKGINKKKFFDIFHTYAKKPPVDRFAPNLACESPHRRNRDKFCYNRYGGLDFVGGRNSRFPYL